MRKFTHYCKCNGYNLVNVANSGVNKSTFVFLIPKPHFRSAKAIFAAPFIFEAGNFGS
jgi:hypothetical protein